MEKGKAPRKGRGKDQEYPNVRKRGKGYTYRYEIPVVSPDGKPGRKQKDTPQYPTPLEAYQAGILIEADLLKGTYVDEDNILFKDWAPRAIQLHAQERKLKATTIHTRNGQIVQLLSRFSGRKLKSIKADEYQDFLLYLIGEGLARDYVKNVHSAARIIFKSAVKRGMISANPTDQAFIPEDKPTIEELELLEDEIDEPVPEFLEKEELAMLLKTIKDQSEMASDAAMRFKLRQLYRIVYIMAHTGIRPGEMSALEEKRVNAEALTLRIIATLDRHGGTARYLLTPPKTKSSIRTVDVSESVMRVFERQTFERKVYKLSVGEKFHTKRDFVFVNCNRLPGYPLDQAEVNTFFKGYLILAGLSANITLHDLRHTFTSLSAEAGATLEEIQKQLGHGSDRMTKLVYLHTTKTRKRVNVESLDRLTSGIIPPLD